jgi:hypothetical protein
MNVNYLLTKWECDGKNIQRLSWGLLHYENRLTVNENNKFFNAVPWEIEKDFQGALRLPDPHTNN